MIQEDLLKLQVLIDNEKITKCDAIICLEGDGLERLKFSAKLFKEKLAKTIVLSGGLENPPFSITAEKAAKELVKMGVPMKNIVIENKSQDTYQQGKEAMKIIKRNKWQKVILVASHFHQLRAFLTFLRTMQEARLKVQIFNLPYREAKWFGKTALGKTRFELLTEEFKKIIQYRKKGHLVDVKKAITYQKWKEQQQNK
ncbi:YdcF family protein [Candidatus Woesearchaeota archaeon]|nr:YdcF family protein [Candidatus Woesearchaeota archaeon]